MNRLVMLIGVALCVACARDDQATPGNQDPQPAAGTAQPPDSWPQTGPVDYRSERAWDLTGDGSPETVRVIARGPRYDSLDIALTIVGERRDTLWHEAWTSLHYFKYDPLEGKQDTTVARIVRSHVDTLLADDRYTQLGSPPRLSQGGASSDMTQEAVRYHLAELDWRGGADLTPADATPTEGYSRIRPEIIAAERVNVVIEELRQKPSFWYYAGGEATYAIAWSDREHAFVRIYSCC